MVVDTVSTNQDMRISSFIMTRKECMAASAELSREQIPDYGAAERTCWRCGGLPHTQAAGTCGAQDMAAAANGHSAGPVQADAALMWVH